MNAKEEIIQILKKERDENITNGVELIRNGYSIDSSTCRILSNHIGYIDTLITATENAIFDVPSEEEIEAEKEKLLNDMMIDNYQVDGFIEGINFILNYKKTETNGK